VSLRPHWEEIFHNLHARLRSKPPFRKSYTNPISIRASNPALPSKRKGSIAKMTRVKNATRKNNFNKRPYVRSHEGNSQDGPPPSKKAKKNPQSSTTINATKTNTTQAQPSSAEAPTADQSHDAIASESVANATDLTNTHDVTTINIISSTHIQQKVMRTLETLSVYPPPPDKKPRAVMLHAKAHYASKMITIAEIVKRETAKDGGKWFQYNKVDGVMMDYKESVKKRRGKEKEDKNKDEQDAEGGEGGEAESEEETTAFETMKKPFERANEGNPKMRAVPFMTIYLSRIRIDGLKKAYG
jgi:hypothetical protein